MLSLLSSRPACGQVGAAAGSDPILVAESRFRTSTSSGKHEARKPLPRTVPHKLPDTSHPDRLRTCQTVSAKPCNVFAVSCLCPICAWYATRLPLARIWIRTDSSTTLQITRLVSGVFMGLGPGAAVGPSTHITFGEDRKHATYNCGAAAEVRYSAAARLWRPTAAKERGGDFDYEGVWQFGSFGPADICAWTIASDNGYSLPNRPLKPRLSMKADISSGDDPRKKTLGTFYPVYPIGNYFGVVADMGLAADSVLAGGENPRWQRRGTAILAMLGEAAAGASMLRSSAALPLFVCGVTTAVSALAELQIQSKGKSK
jgi:Alginate export